MNNDFSLLYHDIRSQIQAIMSLFQVVESSEIEKSKRFKPYILAINALYAVLPKNAYNGEVDLVLYLKSLMNQYESDDRFKLVFILKEESNPALFFQAKQAVYMGMLTNEIAILLKSASIEQNILCSSLKLEFQIKEKTKCGVLIFERFENEKLDIKNILEEDFENLTFLSILIRQLKLDFTLSSQSLKINQL